VTLELDAAASCYFSQSQAAISNQSDEHNQPKHTIPASPKTPKPGNPGNDHPGTPKRESNLATKHGGKTLGASTIRLSASTSVDAVKWLGLAFAAALVGSLVARIIVGSKHDS